MNLAMRTLIIIAVMAVCSAPGFSRNTMGVWTTTPNPNTVASNPTRGFVQATLSISLNKTFAIEQWSRQDLALQEVLCFLRRFRSVYNSKIHKIKIKHHCYETP